MTLSVYFTKLKALWDEMEAYPTPFTRNQPQIQLYNYKYSDLRKK